MSEPASPSSSALAQVAAVLSAPQLDEPALRTAMDTLLTVLAAGASLSAGPAAAFPHDALVGLVQAVPHESDDLAALLRVVGVLAQTTCPDTAVLDPASPYSQWAADTLGAPTSAAPAALAAVLDLLRPAALARPSHSHWIPLLWGVLAAPDTSASARASRILVHTAAAADGAIYDDESVAATLASLDTLNPASGPAWDPAADHTVALRVYDTLVAVIKAAPAALGSRGSELLAPLVAALPAMGSDILIQLNILEILAGAVETADGVAAIESVPDVLNGIVDMAASPSTMSFVLAPLLRVLAPLLGSLSPSSQSRLLAVLDGLSNASAGAPSADLCLGYSVLGLAGSHRDGRSATAASGLLARVVDAAFAPPRSGTHAPEPVIAAMHALGQVLGSLDASDADAVFESIIPPPSGGGAVLERHREPWPEQRVGVYALLTGAVGTATGLAWAAQLPGLFALVDNHTLDTDKLSLAAKNAFIRALATHPASALTDAFGSAQCTDRILELAARGVLAPPGTAAASASSGAVEAPATQSL